MSYQFRPEQDSSKKELVHGFIQIYTGEGKGKTTAALGLMFRAVGYGLDARMLQFMKHVYTSEQAAAERFGFSIEQALATDPDIGCQEILQKAKDYLAEGEVDVLILDETGEALRRGFIDRSDIEALIEMKPDKTELVFTGRYLEDKIGDLADLITEMKLQKHYFDAGVLARKGIEF